MARKLKTMAPGTQRHSTPFLRTKLHRPPVIGGLVYRKRLHDAMNRGLETPLTLVSAPAGYGKSTLVSHWAESLPEPCAWVSLDSEGPVTAIRRAISCRRRLLSVFSRILALMLLAATLRAKVTEKWANEIT